jgi:hypothetical protein
MLTFWQVEESRLTQLTRRVKLGNQLEIECRTEPGERARLPIVLSWRWIADGAVVELAIIAFHQVNSLNWIWGNDTTVRSFGHFFPLFNCRSRKDINHNQPFSGYWIHFDCVCRQSHPVDCSPKRSFGHLPVSRFERCETVGKQHHLDCIQ